MTRHAVIIPARDEAGFIGEMLESLLAQSEPPDRIIVVDDGSTDQTAAIVEQFALRDSSLVLVHRSDKGARAMGGRVVQAFNAGYNLCRGDPTLYISKLDADLRLPPNYFAELLRFLDQHPQVAVAGGALYDRRGDDTVRFRVPPNHIVGALKTFRRSVFDEMGGFQPVSGWDIIDLVKVRSMGYETALLPGLQVLHQRAHGGAEGGLKAKLHWGHGAYVIGSHPLFVLGRGLYRMLEPPYVVGGLALWWGYLKAALSGVKRIPDRRLIAALRREQLTRLRHRNHIVAEPRMKLSPTPAVLAAAAADPAERKGRGTTPTPAGRHRRAKQVILDQPAASVPADGSQVKTPQMNAETRRSTQK